MTQVGGGHEAEETPPVLTFGAPATGEILAERYELAEHINDDNVGRQVWRGLDVVLRRPVAVVLRYPGGESATEMLQAAVAASRVVHPNLAGVYDAIDEGQRAYVVREWVDGRSLREIVADGPLDAARATAVGHAVAAAVAAVHATGMVHGNVHPGTVMIGHDGRVMLADARADNSDTPETDVRSVGGVLYYALTGYWPHAEAALSAAGGATGRGRAALPDAVRDAAGSIAAPRQVRAGVPAYLDDLTMDLLDRRIAAPSSDVLAAELARLDAAAEDVYLDAGPLRFTAADDDDPGRPVGTGGRKIALGVAGLVAIALVGLVIGISALNGDGNGQQAAPSASGEPGSSGGTAAPSAPKPPQPISLSADQVRVIDPDGARDELDGVEAVVDGDPNSGWDTHSYTTAKFGNLKAGMGILISLPEPREIKDVQVVLSTVGASAELRTGPSAPNESSKAADEQIVSSFSNRIGEPYEASDATTLTFSAFQAGQKYQYLLVWITKMPVTDQGRYKIGVQEITVQGP